MTVIQDAPSDGGDESSTAPRPDPRSPDALVPTGSGEPDRTGPALLFLGGGVPSAEEIAAVTAALLSLRRAPAREPAGPVSAPRWSSAPVAYRPPGSWAAR